MDGIEFNDRDFFREQREKDRQWKWPLNLAIAFHVAVFVIAMFLPELLDRKPVLDTIVTVDLVSMPETPKASSVPVQSPVKPVKSLPPPAKVSSPPPEPEKNPEVSVAPEAAVVPEPAAPPEMISLKPLQRKIRKAEDTRLVDEQEELAKKKAARQQKEAEQQRKEAEQLRRKKALAEARRVQLEAERAAARARRELAAAIREKGVVSTPERSSGRTVQSPVFQQYVSSLYTRIHGYWILPEMRSWDRHLETVVVLTIRRDGSVADMQIERKSGDPFFDQFVMKTLQKAAPMPRFPALMRDSSIEVGLRFKPGELALPGRTL